MPAPHLAESPRTITAVPLRDDLRQALDRVPGVQVCTKVAQLGSKSDLQARPISHRRRDSIEAHLTIVFAALAVARWTEARTGWSIRKFVKTARRYREIKIQAGQQTITAADPIPADLRQALNAINRSG